MSNPHHSVRGIRPTRHPGVQTGVDQAPFEAPDDRERRLAQELEAFVDKTEAEQRAARHRKASNAERAPRAQAIAQMARETLGSMYQRATPAAMRRELRANPIYKSLPAAQRAEWDAMIDRAVELGDTGEGDVLWLEIDELAGNQVDSGRLEDWDPREATAEANDPAALAAMIPR